MNNQFAFSYSLTDDGGNAITALDMSLQGDDMSWNDVTDRFTEFLRGCGYVFHSHKELGLVDAK